MSYVGLLTTPVALKMRGDAVPGGEDEHGNPTFIPDYDLKVRGYVARQSASEAGTDGSVMVEQLTLFLEAECPVEGWDAAVIDGHRYEIQGPPWKVRNARTGRVHHVEAIIRRAD